MMDIFEDMNEEQCAKFGEELVDLMAGHHARLAAWFKATARSVVYTEAGMVPFENPEDRLTLAEVESRIRPLVSDEALLPMWMEVIRTAVKGARRKTREELHAEGWRWPDDVSLERGQESPTSDRTFDEGIAGDAARVPSNWTKSR
jgi:hypothetical protein